MNASAYDRYVLRLTLQPSLAADPVQFAAFKTMLESFLNTRGGRLISKDVFDAYEALSEAEARKMVRSLIGDKQATGGQRMAGAILHAMFRVRDAFAGVASSLRSVRPADEPSLYIELLTREAFGRAYNVLAQDMKLLIKDVRGVLVERDWSSIVLPPGFIPTRERSALCPV